MKPMALVAIDVNTGRPQRGHTPGEVIRGEHEAADEVARQLRMRNIGGLVVIDFMISV
jgi:Ribonuclease G/E